MGTQTDFDAMADAAIEACRLAVAHGSPEFRQTMRLALFVLGCEIAKATELSAASRLPTPKRRFYFHLRTEHGLERDTKGSEHSDLDGAYLKAHRMIPAMAVDMMRAGRAPMRCALDITDGQGAVLLEVPFSEVLEPKRQSPVRRAGVLQRKGRSQAERAMRLSAELREQCQELRETIAASRELLARSRART